VVPPTINPSTPPAICASTNESYANKSTFPLAKYGVFIAVINRFDLISSTSQPHIGHVQSLGVLIDARVATFENLPLVARTATCGDELIDVARDDARETRRDGFDIDARGVVSVIADAMVSTRAGVRWSSRRAGPVRALTGQ
jgi:hypothetical protein